MSWRFGIVGAGMIARIHAQALAQMSGCELTGVMDNGRGSGLEIAPGSDDRGAGNIDDFLARDDIDVITISTPSGTHADIAIKAAKAGKHVICEKPLDVSLSQIDAMIKACDDAGVRLGGIFNTRFTAGAIAVKQAVDSGRFGRLTFGQAFGPWWRDQDYYDSSDWKGTWALDGGGALMNQGIHSVDLLQWLMGSPVKRLSGHIATLAHDSIEVEDTGSASLEFANGALGIIACTTSMWPGHFRTITLAGTDGTATLADGNLLTWEFRKPLPEDSELLAQLGGLPGAGVGASDPAAGVDAHGHQAVFEEFLTALESGHKPEIDGVESRKAVEIILAIYESARNNGASVELVT